MTERFVALRHVFISLNICINLGSDNGLKLTLNVEQYEYMPGPHVAAGIKMLVHEPQNKLVHQLGQAVPPGSHSFLGIKMLQV